VKFKEETKKKYGTIYTPEFVVVKTVDLAWKYIPQDKNKLDLTYMDPAVGDGNFLINIYHRLMLEKSDLDPITKSEHILTKCLFGIEILKEMHNTCKSRLLAEHVKTIKQYGNISDHKDRILNLYNNLNIYHGNTITTPEDTWIADIKVGEGGVLPQDIRDKKWDVIVGNPPYTHLRNMEGTNKNYRFKSYPNQRDLAQVFVRWALDHLKEDGVCGYNTTDAWLNVKLIDGAKETRELIDGKIREVANNKEIISYSENGGGNITTFIVCLSNTQEHGYILNGKYIEYTKTELESKYNFLNKFKPNYVDKHSELTYHKEFKNMYNITSINNGKSNKETNLWLKDAIFIDLKNGEKYNILAPYHLGSRMPGVKFKLIKGNIDHKTLAGKWKIISTINNDEDEIMWLFGWLNSDSGLDILKELMRQSSTDGNSNDGDWILTLDNLKLYEMPIPCIWRYINKDSSNQTQKSWKFVKWIKENIKNWNKNNWSNTEQEINNKIKEITTIVGKILCAPDYFVSAGHRDYAQEYHGKDGIIACSYTENYDAMQTALIEFPNNKNIVDKTYQNSIQKLLDDGYKWNDDNETNRLKTLFEKDK